MSSYSKNGKCVEYIENRTKKHIRNSFNVRNRTRCGESEVLALRSVCIRGRTPSKAVVLGLVISLLLSLSFFTPSSTGDFSGTPPSPIGDTFIDDISRWENETVMLNGNLTINSTGELTLYNVTLIMNSTYDGEFGIYVKEGGRFLVYSSSITAYDTTTPVWMQRAGRVWISPGLKYKFAVYGNLAVQDSDIGYLWGLADPPPEIGGIQIYSNDAIIRNSFIHNGAVHGMYAKKARNLTVANTTLSGNNVSGIASLGSEISIEDCTITRNDEYGIRGFYGGGTVSEISVVKVRSSIIHENGFSGIECDWCGLDVDNSEISYNGDPEGARGINLASPMDSRIENTTIAYNNYEGIDVFGCTRLFMANNTIQGHWATGVGLRNCHAVLVSNQILDQKGWIESSGIDVVYNSAPIIRDNILERNDIGIYLFENAKPFVVNSTISSNNVDVRLGGSSGDDPSAVVTLNTTFDKAKVKYVSSGSNLTIEWFMHVKVVDLVGTPVPDALVEIEDINGILIESGQTDNQGLFEWNVVKEYFQEDLNGNGNGEDPGEKTYYTPHNVTASKDGVTGYAIPEPFMSTSKTVIVVLNMTLPTFPDLTLSQSDIIFDPPEPIVNGTVIEINATIHNIGTDNASNAIVRFYDGPPSPANQIDGDRNIPFLLKGGLESVNVSWTPTSEGEHQICVFADPDDTIGELNETNNLACRNVQVFSPIPPSPPSNLNAFLSGEGFRGVTVTWNLSLDDGSGAKSVVEYGIYRSSLYDFNKGGYILRHSVQNGTDEFIDNGAGEGDPSNYFYYLCAVTKANISSCTTNQVGKFSRPLAKGPQLVSIPLIQSNESIETVLQTARFDKAWTYDSSSQKWKWYMSFKTYRRDLWNVNHTMGLWINVTKESNLTVAGVVPINTSIQLSSGWNLVSFPSFNSTYAVADLRADTGAVRVEGFDSLPSYYLRVLGDAETLQAGYAYWTGVQADIVWTVSVQ